MTAAQERHASPTQTGERAPILRNAGGYGTVAAVEPDRIRAELARAKSHDSAQWAATDDEDDEPPRTLGVRRNTFSVPHQSSAKLQEHHPGEWAEWAGELIPTTSLVVPLLVIGFATGIIDAMTLRAYNTFVTNQTGSSSVLAVASVSGTDRNILHAALALAGFVVFAFIFGQLGARIGHRKRWWLVVSLSWQILCILITTILVSPIGPRYTRIGGAADWIGVLLLALNGGPQVTMAVNVGIPEIPTGMISNVYATLLSHRTLLHPRVGSDTVGRDRRVLFLAAFWAGGLIGSAIGRWCGEWLTLLLGGACKCAVLAWTLACRGEDSYFARDES